MKLLFFDCETNGLPIDYKASYTEVNNWPRVLSLAWILADIDANIIQQGSHLIKPEGWMVPTEQFWVDNGYSQARSEEFGIPIGAVLAAFMDAKKQADILVAHNLNFDHRIVWAEFIRYGLEPRSGMHKICTMMKSTSYCKIPAKRGFKWPKLDELHEHLFGCGFDGAHDALTDVSITMKCFFELIKRGVIELPSIEQEA